MCDKWHINVIAETKLQDIHHWIWCGPVDGYSMLTLPPKTHIFMLFCQRYFKSFVIFVLKNIFFSFQSMNLFLFAKDQPFRTKIAC